MTTVLETTGYRAPLAVQATDAATGATVGDALIVRAWPAGDVGAARTARPSPFSSLFGFATLPGLRAQEYAKSAGGGPITWPARSPVPFVVSVFDELGRYLPEVFTVSLPQPAPTAVTLYSSPARPNVPGWAVVAGEAHTTVGAPVGWAVVSVSDGVSASETVTDAAGRFRHYLPYPEALPALAGSPPTGNGIADVQWTLTVRARSQPSQLRWIVGPEPAGPPDVDSIRGQAEAQLSTGNGPHAAISVTLLYGVPLTLALSVISA